MTGRNDRPAAAWSPDGRLVYLLLDRDGFRCLWAQRLDAATKQPLGTPFAVQHWHGCGAVFLRRAGDARLEVAGLSSTKRKPRAIYG